MDQNQLKRAIIFGCGANYHRYRKNFEKNFEIVGLIDNDPGKQNGETSSIELLDNCDYDLVVITTMIYEGIEAQLIKYGVDPECIKIAALDHGLFKNEIMGCDYYGQHGEDLVVASIFSQIGIEKPSYMDLGANHPIMWSNTALMHRNGCRGINVEANPHLIKYFYKVRPDDINVNVGIACENGTMPYYVFTEDSGLNTFSKEEAEKADIPYKEIRELPVITLVELVDKYCPDGFPDYLDCDIEGLDYDVLFQYDLKCNGPKVISVEVRSPEIEKFDSMLSDKDYFRFCRIGENNIYVRNEYRPELMHIS